MGYNPGRGSQKVIWDRVIEHACTVELKETCNLFFQNLLVITNALNEKL